MGVGGSRMHGDMGSFVKGKSMLVLIKNDGRLGDF